MTNDKSLEKVNPELAKELDIFKNGFLPSQISYGSNKKIWWLCSEYGHSFQAVVGSRAIRGTGCPYCKNQKLLKGFNDLETVVPTLAKEWHPTKNGELTPSNTRYTSTKRIWWKCESCEGSWDTKLSTRYYGNTGCPYCTNRKLLLGVNDIKTRVPHIANEWHPTRNKGVKPEDVIYGSNFLFWFKCNICDYSWRTSISDRIFKGYGCPNCNLGTNTSTPERTVFFYVSEAFPDAVHRVRLNGREADIFIPSNKLIIEYDGAYWHKDKVWEDTIKVAELQEYTIIRLRADGLPIIEGSNCINISINSRDLDEAVNSLLDKLSNMGYTFKKVSVDVKRDYLTIIKSYEMQEVERSLKTTYPEIAEELNPAKNKGLQPTQLSYARHIDLIFTHKDCGRDYKKRLSLRTCRHGQDCPYCEKDFSVHSKLVYKGEVLGLRFWYGKRLADVEIEYLEGNSIKIDLDGLIETELKPFGNQLVTKEELERKISIHNYTDDERFLKFIEKRLNQGRYQT